MTDQTFTPIEDIPTLSYEEARKELALTVKQLQAGDLHLDDALFTWERGEKLAHHCEELLTKAEARIAQLKASSLANNEE